MKAMTKLLNQMIQEKQIELDSLKFNADEALATNMMQTQIYLSIQIIITTDAIHTLQSLKLSSKV